MTKGDRDCSSAVCEAWELALASSPYDGLITRYNWTGGMREMFVGSGLFSWEPMSFNASRGDIYLDEENHTAMCIRNDGTADLLGEFSISETGGIDGEPGDQTGRESWVHDYYSGSWDGILHYNGKADVGGAPGGSGSGAPSGDVSELAARVIAGDFGNGDARRAALGSRYDEVQARSTGSSQAAPPVAPATWTRSRAASSPASSGTATSASGAWGPSTRPCRIE